MEIKLIASDLDGTLFTDKKELSPMTRRALDMAMERGIIFVPATGRSFQAVPEMIRSYPGIDYVMTSNGGAIYSVRQNKRIYQCMLTEQTVQKILELPIPESITPEAFVQGVPYSEERYIQDPAAFGATEFGVGYVKRTRHPVKDMKKFLYEHRNEMDEMSFVCADAGEREEFCRMLQNRVPDIYITCSMDHLLEIGHKDAGKGKTLKRLLKFLDICPEEAAAFGDADNDSDMLSAVRYGIAVANASPSCRAAASWITASNEEEGVAKAILRFLDVEDRTFL